MKGSLFRDALHFRNIRTKFSKVINDFVSLYFWMSSWRGLWPYFRICWAPTALIEPQGVLSAPQFWNQAQDILKNGVPIVTGLHFLWKLLCWYTFNTVSLKCLLVSLIGDFHTIASLGKKYGYDFQMWPVTSGSSIFGGTTWDILKGPAYQRVGAWRFLKMRPL